MQSLKISHLTAGLNSSYLRRSILVIFLLAQNLTSAIPPEGIKDTKESSEDANALRPPFTFPEEGARSLATANPIELKLLNQTLDASESYDMEHQIATDAVVDPITDDHTAPEFGKTLTATEPSTSTETTPVLSTSSISSIDAEPESATSIEIETNETISSTFESFSTPSNKTAPTSPSVTTTNGPINLAPISTPTPTSRPKPTSTVAAATTSNATKSTATSQLMRAGQEADGASLIDHVEGKMPSGVIAIVTTITFAVVAVLGYVSLIIWRRYLEYRYGNRELLVNDLEFDTNDLRHFEL